MSYLVISLEEINCRKALNTHSGYVNFIGVTVDLHNGNVVVSFVFHSEILPNRCQSLAVTTPEKKRKKEKKRNRDEEGRKEEGKKWRKMEV